METSPPPTKASEVLHAVMQEEGWNRREVASATGMDYKTVLRWLDGSSNPPQTRIAEVLERLDRDPKKYGVNTPRPVRAHADRDQLDRIEAKLDAMLRLQLGLPGAKEEAMKLVTPQDPRG